MPDRIFDILIDIQAKAQALQDVSKQLEAVKADAAETAVALDNVRAPQIDASGGIHDTSSVTAATAAEAVRTAELTQQAAIESQIQVIAQTRLDLTAALVSGETASAEALRSELAVRNATLGVMRSQTLTAAELNALTEQEAALLAVANEQTTATAASSLLAGANLNKAKGEAIVLARELATGSVNARTLGALLGSLGTTLTIASLVGYELYKSITEQSDEALKLLQNSQKETAELEKQVTVWIELAKSAGDFGDVIKLADKAGPELARLAALDADFRTKELSAWQKFFDTIASMWSFIPGSGVRPYAQALDAATKDAQARAQQALRDANASIDIAQRAADEWQRVQALPLPQAIETYSEKVDDLKSKLASIDRTKSPADFQEWSRVAAELELAEKRLDELSKSEDKLDQQSAKIGDSIRKADFAQLDPAGKLSELSTELTSIQDKLHLFGIEAATPQEALAQAKNLTKDSAEEVIKLAGNWARVNEEVDKVNKSEDRAGHKSDLQDINALLREQASLIESIHQKQQLIDANTFLSPDAKQTATLANMVEEMRALDAQIAIDKTLLKDGSLDPQTYERVAAEMQKLVADSQLLAVKMQTLQRPFDAELANYFNSFGTSAKQAADVVTGTLNSALQGTNQLLLDSVFRTGNWKQALVGVEEQIAQLFLTFIEHQAEQFLAQQLGITTTTATQVASGAEIAAAHAPAAAATSISSYGAAAVVGEVLAIAAIGAIIAALSGGFKRGGFTGHGDPDEVAGPVHRGEYVFTAEEVQAIGGPVAVANLKQAIIGGAVQAASVSAPSTEGFRRGGYADEQSNYWREPDVLPGVDLPDDVLFDRRGYPTGPEVAINPRAEIPAPGTPDVGTGDPRDPEWVSPFDSGYPHLSGTPAGDWAKNARRGGGDRGGDNVGVGIFGGSPFDARGFPTGAGFDLAGFGPGGSGLFGFGDSSGGGGGGGGGGSGFGAPPIVRIYHTGGNVDTEHAMLSIGEFVTRKAAVDHYGPELFHALNNMTVPVPAPLRMAGGGLVGGAGSGSGSGGSNVFNPTVQVLAFTNQKDLVNHIMNNGDMKMFVVETMKGAVHEVGVNAV